MVDKKLEAIYAEHYFTWADKERELYQMTKSHFPRVYVAFTPTNKMCKLYNVCSPIPVYVHPYAAPAFQMAFGDLNSSIDTMRTLDGSPFVLENRDIITDLAALRCLSDSPSGPLVENAQATSSTKPECLQEINLGVFNRRCYTAGDHGSKCSSGIDFHSYGVGMYVKVAENPSVDKSQASSLSQTGEFHNFPMEFIGIMKRYGFEWGGDVSTDEKNFQPARFTLRASPGAIWSNVASGPQLNYWWTDRTLNKPAHEIMEYCAKRFVGSKQGNKVFMQR